MKPTLTKTYIILHLMLLMLSLSGLCSKLAAGRAFLSPAFCVLYGGMIVVLGVYAIGWQQVIKRLSLSTAYANKAATVVWGMIWGAVVFGEKISAGKLAGAAIVMIGIVLYARSEEEIADE